MDQDRSGDAEFSDPIATAVGVGGTELRELRGDAGTHRSCELPSTLR
ncbi:MAG: hypothetical protein ACKOPS_14630 [Cyanobium sp.]